MNEIITSKNNKLIKLVNKLSRKKYRQSTSLFVIESEKLVLEALESGLDIKEILMREDYLDKGRLGHLKKTYIEKDLFNSISNLVTPDGIMAVASIKEMKKKLTSDRVLILENLQDPGNIGSLIRSAEAFDFKDVLLLNSVDLYNEKVLRASMGSAFRLNILNVDYQYLIEVKKDGYKLISADMFGKDYRDILYEGKIALVIGNEGQGISNKMKNIVDMSIKIPMSGQIESLNAAVSGSILMSSIKLNR